MSCARHRRAHYLRAKFFREDQAAFINTSGKQWMAYRKMGTAAVNGSALDRLAGKVAERSEALVARWGAQAEAATGGMAGSVATIEVDIDDAAQAVTLEVIHEAGAWGRSGSRMVLRCHNVRCHNVTRSTKLLALSIVSKMVFTR